MAKDLNEEGTAFYWRELNGVKALICKPLEDAGFVNGFSARLGGVSPFPDGDLNLAGFNEDSASNIYENRRRFLLLFGEFELATVWQVHGDEVRVVNEPGDAGDSNINADAIISKLGGVLIGVKTADCVPVLIGDPVTGAFASVHAGWRGTVRRIVQNTIRRMNEEFGVEPDHLVCAIGPAASGRRYEVGGEVIESFADHKDPEKYFQPTRDGHATIDLHWVNRDQLEELGVSASNIFATGLCTIERTDLFFSSRIEKQTFGKTGRSLSVIGREELP